MINETVFYGVSVSNITNYPSFDIRLSGVLFHLPPTQYFIPLEPVENGYIIGIRKWDQVSVWRAIEK